MTIKNILKIFLILIIIILITSCGKNKKYETATINHTCVGTVCALSIVDLNILVFPTVAGDREKVLSRENFPEQNIEIQYKTNNKYSDVNNKTMQDLGLPLCGRENCPLNISQSAVRFAKTNILVHMNASGKFKTKENKWQAFKASVDWVLSDLLTPKITYKQQGNTNTYSFTITNFKKYQQDTTFKIFNSNGETQGEPVTPNPQGSFSENIPPGDNQIQFIATYDNINSKRSTTIPITIVPTPTLTHQQQGDTNTYNFTITNFSQYQSGTTFKMFNPNGQTKTVNPDSQGKFSETLPVGDNHIRFQATQNGINSPMSDTININIPSTVTTPNITYQQQGNTNTYNFTITNFSSYQQGTTFKIFNSNGETQGKTVTPNHNGVVTETLPAGDNQIQFIATYDNINSKRSTAIPITIVPTPTVRYYQQGNTNTYDFIITNFSQYHTASFVMFISGVSKPVTISSQGVITEALPVGDNKIQFQAIQDNIPSERSEPPIYITVTPPSKSSITYSLPAYTSAGILPVYGPRHGYFISGTSAGSNKVTFRCRYGWSIINNAPMEYGSENTATYHGQGSSTYIGITISYLQGAHSISQPIIGSNSVKYRNSAYVGPGHYQTTIACVPTNQVEDWSFG